MTETKILKDDPRAPLAGHLTYSADADVPSPLQPMGPTTLGPRDYVYPVTRERVGDKLRVGFASQAPAISVIVANYAHRLEEIRDFGDRQLVKAAIDRAEGRA